MLQLLTSQQSIATVSTKQIPYPDADLFARYQVSNHIEALNLHNDFVCEVPNFGEFARLPFLLKRKIVSVDDVCAVYKRDIFENLNKFDENLSFGEDMEFAVRSIKTGYKTGFIGTDGVIHSHNRKPYYFFKRTFVSTLCDSHHLNIQYKTKLNIANLYSIYLKLIQTAAYTRYLHPNFSENSISELKNYDIITNLTSLRKKLKINLLLNLDDQLIDQLWHHYFTQMQTGINTTKLNQRNVKKHEIKTLLLKIISASFGHELAKCYLNDKLINKHQRKILNDNLSIDI
jgi:hypothetical protein